MMTKTDWTREEVGATVTDYFAMLEAELRGEPVNKAEHNRNLRKIVHRLFEARVK